MGESTDIDDTTQLLIFVRGISENFELTEELLSMESMKDTTTGEDIFECVKTAIRAMKLQRQKMVSVTMDGCPSLTRKDVGLQRRLSDRVAEVDYTRELIFLDCIIDRKVLRKKVLDMKHVVDSVAKIVNFISARSLNQSLSRFWKIATRISVWDRKTEILLFLEIKAKDKDFPQLKTIRMTDRFGISSRSL